MTWARLLEDYNICKFCRFVYSTCKDSRVSNKTIPY